MNWKAYKTWAKVTAVALLVTSCSSDKANKGQRDYQAEHAKLVRYIKVVNTFRIILSVHQEWLQMDLLLISKTF
ncbi:murein transglycosylase A [Actinobacillus equuli]|nr:murein transglycosylase A [Actinobacillus equuli]